MSLDGYIAGPKGEYDWIAMDPDIDFRAIFKEVDTLLMGRKSYEVARAQGGGGACRECKPTSSHALYGSPIAPA
jgi:dihydrofolate reductase